MVNPVTKSVVCPVIIGRSAYIDALRAALAQARQGSGQTMLVTGDAGIGKSRLIAELKALSNQQKMLTLQGDCFEGDRTFPFAPIIDLLRQFINTNPSDKVKQHFTDPALLSILPELNWLSTTPLVTAPEPENEKRKLFYTLLQTITQLASQQPVLMVVEDLHWCDDISLEWLLYLARHLKTQPILLILSYRSDEVQPSLQHKLNELNRARLVTEIRLEALSANDIDQMLRLIFDLRRPVDSDFLETMTNLTEGNPFYIEEVLKSLLMSGDVLFVDVMLKPLKDMHIPNTIRDLVQRRSGQLSFTAHHTLTVAAIIGRRFVFSLLRDVLQVEEQELVSTIKELIAAQLVIEESQEGFTFRHALIQQAIYFEPLMRERQLLHRQVAEAMERYFGNSSSNHLDELAYQFYKAGEWSKTFDYAQRAGHKALDLYAPYSALEHLTHALEAAYQLEKPLPSSIYRARGKAYERLGEFTQAQADFESAIRIARTNQDRQQEWESFLDLGAMWAGRDYNRTQNYYQSALNLAREMQEIPLIVSSLNRLGNWHMNIEQPIEALRYHQEALTTFEMLNFELGTAETLMFLGFTYCFVSDTVQSAAAFERAAELLRKYDIREGLIYALGGMTLGSSSHVTDTLIAGPVPLATVVNNVKTAWSIARDMNWRGGEAFILIWLGACASTQGHYEQALHYAQMGIEVCEAIGNREHASGNHAELGFIYSELSQWDQARQHLELALELAHEIGSFHYVRLATGLLAVVHIQQGDLDRADAILNAALGSDTALHTPGQRRCWYARALLALARRNPESALKLLDNLASSAANTASGQLIPLLENKRGEALIALERWEEAEATLQAAHMAALSHGAASLIWQSDALLSKCYQAQGKRDEALEALQRAQTLIDKLASEIEDADLRASFLEGAAQQLPNVRPLSARQAAKHAYNGLTAREQQVASLIARGLTNRQIAEALVISEDTATVHVKHILSKLNFTSRAQIAAWAVEVGLNNASN